MSENLSKETVKTEYDEKMFLAARNAKDIGDVQTAIKHYEAISALEPNNWEALFYLVILKIKTITNAEILDAASGIVKCIPKVFEMIENTITDELEKEKVIREVVSESLKSAFWLQACSNSFCNEVSSSYTSFDFIGAGFDLDAKRREKYKSAQRMAEIGNIACVCGNAIEEYCDLDNKVYQEMAVICWKAMLDMHFEHIKDYKVAVFTKEGIEEHAKKVQRFEPAYVLPKLKATERTGYTIKFILLLLGALGVTFLFGILFFWRFW